MLSEQDDGVVKNSLDVCDTLPWNSPSSSENPAPI